MSTIFDNVVTKENDHTNLLRNIMERNPKAAATVLSYLLNRNVSEVEAASLEFRTQHSFSGVNGREIPDILVEGHSFRCLIEAKVDPALELTAAQAGGYQACFMGNGCSFDRYLSSSSALFVVTLGLQERLRSKKPALSENPDNG